MITLYHHLNMILSGQVSKQSAELNRCDSEKNYPEIKKLN